MGNNPDRRAFAQLPSKLKEQHKMKISVVTAVYNRALTIADTINSVQRQSYADVEHIIQDGASTDHTLDIVSSMQDDRTNVVSEPDGGIYDAINRGIKRAQGDVIGLMHSDDVFADDAVLQTVADALQDPGIDGIYGNLDYVHAARTQKIIRHWRAGTYSNKKLKRGWMPPHPTLYLRRHVFEKHGLYDVNFKISADYDAMLRYLAIGNINLLYIPRVLVKMRVGGASNGTLAQIARKTREDLRAIKRNGVGGVDTLIFKNISKIGQFVAREKS